MPNIDALYNELIDDLKQTALLRSCGDLLSWDEQTYLPAGGVEHRAAQLSLLAGMVHERSSAPRRGEILAALESGGELGAEDSPRRANVRETRRQYDRAVKLPRRLIEELSRVCSFAQQAWIESRKNDDFPKFQPWLEQIVRLKREEAAAVGYGNGAPYDALLDQYEAGATARDVDAVFRPLRDELVRLVAAIGPSSRRPDASILTRRYPVEAQKQFALAAARQIGFNFDDGRLDVAAHPFCNGIGPGDCRLTTRYDEQHFPGAFFGVLHEAGHGIYEQGLDRAAFGTPMGQAVSLGVHESQSRLWENFVGRSRAFWKHFFAPAQRAFSEALSGVSAEEFYRAINDVRPSMIRVEADEATYNLHIMLRFELEQAILRDDLQVSELPGVWNETFTRYFGLTPANNAQGCLQDIHWSMGAIGYFPTYSLGNMYAAQLFEAAGRDLGDLHAQFERGEFDALRGWLNAKIHRAGQQYPPAKLIETVTGQKLSHKPLVAHLHARFDELYGL